MSIAIMQPYLFPRVHYFQLMYASDAFVIYDDANYIKGGFINRNKLLNTGGGDKFSMFTLPLDHDSSNKKINELNVSVENFDKFKNKFFKTLKYTYSKAPFFKDTFSLIVDCLESSDSEKLSDICICSLKNIYYWIAGEPVDIRKSSELSYDRSLDAQGKVISICKSFSAHIYINFIGGQHLYDSKAFADSGLELQFIKIKDLEYKQFNKEFAPNLSIIDTLMFNGKEGTLKFLDKYDIVSKEDNDENK